MLYMYLTQNISGDEYIPEYDYMASILMNTDYKIHITASKHICEKSYIGYYSIFN